MKNVNPTLLAAGLVCLAIAVLLGLWLENPSLRYAASLTWLALAFGLIRRAFRVE